MHDDFEARRMKRRRFLRRHVAWIVPLGVVVAVGFFFGIGKLVEWLWRVTVSDIFAIKPISFWQAWGLILLSQILFKANMQRSFGVGPRHPRRSEPAPDTASGQSGHAPGM